MADKTVTKIKTTKPNIAAVADWTALAASDRVIVAGDFKDEYTQFHFKNAGSTDATVTFKAGNAYMGVNDLVISVAAGKESFVTIDTSRFKNISGADSGKIILAVSAALSIKVCEARI